MKDAALAHPPVEEIDISQIMRLIPHRYPFLMIDRIVDLIPGESAVGEKKCHDQRTAFSGALPR